MARRRMTYDDWGAELARTRGGPEYAEFMGPSPGGAAAQLKVSRPFIHKLMLQGRLDAIYLRHRGEGRATAILITDASIARYKLSRASDQRGLPFPRVSRKTAMVKRG